MSRRYGNRPRKVNKSKLRDRAISSGGCSHVFVRRADGSFVCRRCLIPGAVAQTEKGRQVSAAYRNWKK